MGCFLNVLQELQAHIRSLLPDLPLPEAEKQRVLVGLCDPFTTEGPPNLLPKAPFQIVDSDELLVDLGSKLKVCASPIVLDIETTAIEPENGTIVSIGIGFAGDYFYIPLGHTDDGGKLLPNQFPLLAVVQALPLQSLKFIAHNAKFQYSWLKHHAGIELQIFWDTLLAGKLLDFNQPADLERMACRMLDAVEWSLSSEDMKSFAKVPLEKAANYNSADLINTYKLFELQRKEFADEPSF